MEKEDEPKTYEAVPASMSFPMAPIPAEGELPEKGANSGDSKPVLIRGFQSLSGSVNGAQQKAQGLLAECRRAITARDVATFLDHLDDHPYLVGDAWVRETLHRLATQKRLRRRRGRRSGSFELHPLWVVGLVTQFMQSGEAKNTEQALGHLEELGVMSYESAKDSYYRALADTRFRPILLFIPQLAKRLTEEESAAIDRIPTLKPGTTIHTTATNVASGETIEISFSAEPQ